MSHGIAKEIVLSSESGERFTFRAHSRMFLEDKNVLLLTLEGKPDRPLPFELAQDEVSHLGEFKTPILLLAPPPLALID